jgi:hypothetical protein
MATLALVTLAGPIFAGPAFAQPKKAELEAAKKEAVAIADNGVEAFRAEKYQDAIDAFKKADQRFHVPKFLLYVARAQAKLGKLLDAKATYQSVVDEKLAAYAPDAFFAAQTDAKKELVEVENRIPTVRIEVSGLPEGQAPTVTIDGVGLAASDLRRPLALDPGPHAIVVTAPGRLQITRNVNLRESGLESVILEMGVTAPPVPSVTTSSPDGAGSVTAPAQASSGAPEQPKGGGIPALTIASWSVGAAGLVAGAVMGGLAIAKHDEYNKAPTKEALNQGRRFSLVADIGFGTAVAGAAVGTIYWLVSKPAGDAKAQPSKGGFFVAPAVGTAGSGAVLAGRF